MAPGDPFAVAVEPNSLRLARDKDYLSLLLVGNGRKGDLEARIEQGGVDPVLAELGCYRSGHGDASERFILAHPNLGDALEGGPVDQAMPSEATVEPGAINPLSHSRPDRPDRSDRFRLPIRERHCTR